MENEPALPDDAVERFVSAIGDETLARLQQLLSTAAVCAQRTRNRLNGLAGGGPVVVVRKDSADDEDEGWLNNDDQLWGHLDEATRAINELVPLLDIIATNDDCPPELDGREILRKACSSVSLTRDGVRIDAIDVALDHARDLATHASRLRGLYSAVGALADTAADYTHSSDFSTVNWFGTRYTFTRQQATCVKLLWGEFEKDELLGLSEKEIHDRVDSSSDRFRLDHVFRSSGRAHPAWGTMIERIAEATYALRRPNHPNTTA